MKKTDKKSKRNLKNKDKVNIRYIQIILKVKVRRHI